MVRKKENELMQRWVEYNGQKQFGNPEQLLCVFLYKILGKQQPLIFFECITAKTEISSTVFFYSNWTEQGTHSFYMSFKAEQRFPRIFDNFLIKRKSRDTLCGLFLNIQRQAQYSTMPCHVAAVKVALHIIYEHSMLYLTQETLPL